MALDIETSSNNTNKVKIPDFRGKKKGKTKAGKQLSRVSSPSTENEVDIQENLHVDDANVASKELKAPVTTEQKKNVSLKTSEKSSKTVSVKKQSPFVVSTETKQLLQTMKQLGPVIAMYYQILKQSVKDKNHFLASKKDVADLLGISSHRAGKVLKELVDKNVIEIKLAEDSTNKTGKTYRIV